MSYRFVQNSMSLNDLERSKHITHVQSPVTKSNSLGTQPSAHISPTNLLVLVFVRDVTKRQVIWLTMKKIFS